MPTLVKFFTVKIDAIQFFFNNRLSDFKLDFAEVRQISAESKRAHAVEVCDCPRGYAGHSCEICAPGYRSVRRGFYLGLCEPV
jgi:hypothetical protein